METIADVKRVIDDMQPNQLIDIFAYTGARAMVQGVFDGDGLDRTIEQLEQRAGVVHKPKPIARRPKRKR